MQNGSDDHAAAATWRRHSKPVLNRQFDMLIHTSFTVLQSLQRHKTGKTEPEYPKGLIVAMQMLI
jgi:hypothetical protein